MATESVVGRLSRLSSASLGVFRGRTAPVTRNQLSTLLSAGAIERLLPDTYRMTVVPRSNEQWLRAALLWAGADAAAAGRSAAEVYGLECVRAQKPEIIVSRHLRNDRVAVHRTRDLNAHMLRTHRGLRVTGVEATLVALAATLDGEAFEIACEDARRRRLTTVPALNTYVARFGHSGLPGVAAMRELLRELDPVHPSRSTLEVKTRRLLVAHGIHDFVREYPLTWNGRTHFFDFAFTDQRTILETNGRRWHDDPADYEDDNEKWSVAGRHGYRIVFATWAKVTRNPSELVRELAAALAA